MIKAGDEVTCGVLLEIGQRCTLHAATGGALLSRLREQIEVEEVSQFERPRRDRSDVLEGPGAVVDDEPALLLLLELRRDIALGTRRGRDLVVVFPDQREGLIRIDVAHHDHRRVGRLIVGVEIVDELRRRDL